MFIKVVLIITTVLSCYVSRADSNHHLVSPRQSRKHLIERLLRIKGRPVSPKSDHMGLLVGYKKLKNNNRQRLIIFTGDVQLSNDIACEIDMFSYRPINKKLPSCKASIICKSINNIQLAYRAEKQDCDPF